MLFNYFRIDELLERGVLKQLCQGPSFLMNPSRNSFSFQKQFRNAMGEHV